MQQHKGNPEATYKASQDNNNNNNEPTQHKGNPEATYKASQDNNNNNNEPTLVLMIWCLLRRLVFA
jgi:hypothetical protein